MARAAQAPSTITWTKSSGSHGRTMWLELPTHPKPKTTKDSPQQARHESPRETAPRQGSARDSGSEMRLSATSLAGGQVLELKVRRPLRPVFRCSTRNLRNRSDTHPVREPAHWSSYLASLFNPANAQRSTYKPEDAQPRGLPGTT